MGARLVLDAAGLEEGEVVAAAVSDEVEGLLANLDAALHIPWGKILSSPPAAFESHGAKWGMP